MNCPALISKLNTPKVMWYQNDFTVVLRVLMTDVENYYLRVDYDHLRFSTTKNGKDYYICIYLYGAIIPENTSHVNLGREIKINLIKAHKWTGWLRLCIENSKNSMIIPDPDNLYHNDWSTAAAPVLERESFAEYKRRNHITHLMPDMASSDEDLSDDELMDLLLS